MKPILTFLIIFTIQGFAFSSNLTIEEAILKDPELSVLDAKLKALYSEAEKEDCLKFRNIISFKKWIKHRNYVYYRFKKKRPFKLIRFYKNQIKKFERKKNLSDYLISARRVVVNSLIPGTNKINQNNNLKIFKESSLTRSEIYASSYFKSLALKEQNSLRESLSGAFHDTVSLIEADVNNDGFEDIFIYQVVGTGHYTRFYILFGNKNGSYNYLVNSLDWGDETSFPGSVKFIRINNKNFMFNGDCFANNSEVRITLFKIINKERPERIIIPFDNKRSYKIYDKSYHKEFNWIKDNLEKVKNFIENTKHEKIQCLGIKDNKITFKKYEAKVKPENWMLKEYADKYDSLTSYKYINNYDPNFLFFKGSDGASYMIYWSNATLGWRNSDNIIMFLYKISENKAEYMDSLYLKSIKFYYVEDKECRCCEYKEL